LFAYNIQFDINIHHLKNYVHTKIYQIRTIMEILIKQERITKIQVSSYRQYRRKDTTCERKKERKKTWRIKRRGE
jgi:virulence-associated protein VapD